MILEIGGDEHCSLDVNKTDCKNEQLLDRHCSSDFVMPTGPLCWFSSFSMPQTPHKLTNVIFHCYFSSYHFHVSSLYSSRFSKIHLRDFYPETFKLDGQKDIDSFNSIFKGRKLSSLYGLTFGYTICLGTRR